MDLHLYLSGVVLSFTLVLHLYRMSKWLNELNIINLKLYMFYMLIPWGVMTSHLRNRDGKFIEVQQVLYWSFEQFMKEY